MKFDFLKGEILLIDKPYEWTSFDVVNRLRWNIKHKLGVKNIKVGHAGTLDPLATGLLIICTGKYTKRIDEFQAQEKEYTCTFKLGETTPSFDLEKDIDFTFPYEHITRESALKAMADLSGEYEQMPPIFSAKKIDGERAFIKARQGIDAGVKPKLIEVSEFEMTRFELPEIDARIKCSKGTYIRALARDLGQKLNSGAHLTALRRTKIGDFSVENAISPQLFLWLLNEEV